MDNKASYKHTHSMHRISILSDGCVGLRIRRLLPLCFLVAIPAPYPFKIDELNIVIDTRNGNTYS